MTTNSATTDLGSPALLATGTATFAGTVVIIALDVAVLRAVATDGLEP
jgi:hypothetical protein